MIDSTWAIATGLLATLGPALIPETGSWGSVLLIVGFAVLVLGLAVVTETTAREIWADTSGQVRIGFTTSFKIFA